jgi:hypothetical protein
MSSALSTRCLFQRSHLLISDFDGERIDVPVELGANAQPLSDGGGGNEVDDNLMTDEWPATPAFGDMAKHAPHGLIQPFLQCSVLHSNDVLRTHASIHGDDVRRPQTEKLFLRGSLEAASIRVARMSHAGAGRSRGPSMALVSWKKFAVSELGLSDTQVGNSMVLATRATTPGRSDLRVAGGCTGAEESS